MRDIAVADASDLPRVNADHKDPLWWGFLGMIAIETAVFATLIVSYFYLRMGQPEWPPDGIKPPELFLPTVNTLLLIASSGVMVWAEKGIRKGNQRRLAIGLAVGIALAVTFLSLKVFEYSHVDYSWSTNAYGSIVWTIIGFHSTHVTALILKTTVMDVLAWKGFFNEERRLGVAVNGLYWHFVVLIWLPLYVVLYWAPRLL
jgi:cytochrome c oxidase subunit 3